MYNQHIGGTPHADTVSASQWLKCNLCTRYYIAGTPMQFDHERGDRHLRRLGSYPVNAPEPAIVPIEAPPDHTRCDACSSTMTIAQFVVHQNTPSHLARQRILDCRSALLRTQSNQRGVEVSGPQDGLDFGILHAVPNPAPTMLSVTCTRVEPGAVSLTHARITSSVGAHPAMEPRFTAATVALPTEITPHNNIAVEVRFDPHGQRGCFKDRLELVFQEPDDSIFVITRPLKAVVGDSQDLLTLAPTQPYRRPRRAAQHNETRVIPEGEEPHGPVRYLRRLRFEGIPAAVTELFQQGSLETQIASFREQFMTEGLSFATFQQYWSNLVHLEHYQAKIELSYFNRDNVSITQVGNLYQLDVPGLAEKRPSVLIGDRIKLHPHSEDDGVWFRGVVRQTEDAAVRISFHQTFPWTPTARYNVKFALNPVPFRRMHHALQITPKRLNLLFPEPNDMQAGAGPAPGTNTADLVLYNDSVGLNNEQFQAVRRIMELPPGSPPFVVFGPPGTGKTVTIVEGICQLLNNKNNRVLACAPSNSASDLIARRLITNAGLQPDRLFRLNATGRLLGEFPDELLPYSYRVDERFTVPPLATLDSYQIIVATCSSAAILHGIGVDPGAFSHIFVDEAGQGLEPEAMIPILTMSGPKTSVILSGDPKQLGPVIQSPVARELGLNESYLQRLMNSPAYDEATMRDISVVKLLQNFRSHSSILAFPNREFYSDELITSAPPPIANSLLNSGWNGLGDPGFPVIFDAVSGGDEREGSSPSYFNPLEASVVREYVQSLIPFIASTRNIGIVTPYRGQVRKIKALLREMDITDIDVGSVEQFQGQERQVIIVSTVRSSQDLLSFDLRHTLGFVANDQRLNVAITRAQALLIVVGDPQVLGLDGLWRRFMYYIHIHGGWKGTPFPWDPNADPGDAGITSELAAQETMNLLRRGGHQGANEGSDDSEDADQLDDGAIDD